MRWASERIARQFAEDIVLLKQVGMNPDRRSWRRPSDRRDAGAAQDQELVHRRPARHRPRDRRDRRDGAVGLDQQGDRHGDQQGGRPGRRPLRQGCRSHPGAQARAHAPPPTATSRRCSISASSASPYAINTKILELLGEVGHHSGDRADRRRRGGRDLQHQRRHGGGRGRRGDEGDAAPAVDRCRGRARQGQEADPASSPSTERASSSPTARSRAA